MIPPAQVTCLSWLPRAHRRTPAMGRGRRACLWQGKSSTAVRSRFSLQLGQVWQSAEGSAWPPEANSGSARASTRVMSNTENVSRPSSASPANSGVSVRGER